jgi:exodeoxyribonuclease V alpha subunit
MILAKRAKMLSVLRNGDGVPWLAETRKAENERLIAERVQAMLAAPSQWPDTAGLDISEHQSAELAKALQTSIGLFGGSPGTGKTYSAARLIGRIIDLCGADQIAVCAPTGKAAVRISEALASYEVAKTATTIHRLLGVSSHSSGDGWGFTHNEGNPLPHKYFVIDEGSMVDTDLFASLLRALPAGAHLLIVGDVNQLPPVGHGAPLRDMLAAGIPAGELTKIERNWGAIVQACADIRDGKRWQTVKELAPELGQNLKLLPTASGADSVEKIVEKIRQIRDSKLCDPIWDVQIIVAVNKKSELSRLNLNKRLQAELNPAGERCGSNPFRVGDKIVCLKNSLMPIVEGCPSDCNRDACDNKVFVANGEQARVVAVAEKLTTVSLDAPKRLIKIPRGAENGDGDKENDSGSDQEQDSTPATSTGCQWDLAYAISCHKSQGSEWPGVFVAIDEYPGARRICSREWVYTAISRARLFCLLVGKRSIADGMCCTQAIKRRKTFLTGNSSSQSTRP